MNNKIIAAAIFSIAASIGAQAQAQVYAGATVGTSSYNIDCSALTACDTTGTAFKVLTGYQVTPLLGVEASYFDLGSISAQNGSANYKGRATGVDVAAVLRMQLNQDIGLFTRLGVANIKGKITGTQGTSSATSSQSSTQALFGIGATYNINNTLRVRTEIEGHRANIDTKSSNIVSYSIGLENAF